MKLRQVFENVFEPNPGGQEHDGGLKTIGICYGRFNPPHKGHKAVWQAAAKNPIWFVGTNANTGGSDAKNPLPYDVKLQCMEAVWPKVAGHVIPEQDLFVMASNIYEKYGSNVHLKVYTDEAWLYQGLVKYNGLKDQKHGHYNFVQIDHVPTERLASATNLRAAVRSGDRKAFYHDMGVSPSVTITVGDREMPLFDVVAHYLNQFPEKVAKKTVAAAEDLNDKKKTWADYGMPDAEEHKPKEKHYHGWTEYEHEKQEQEVKKKKEKTPVQEANDYIREHRTSKLRKNQKNTSKGVTRSRDVGGYDRVYHLNRIGLALAMADGQDTKPVDSPADTWFEKYNTYHPYTKEEDNMIKAAHKTVPSDSNVVSNYSKSLEDSDVNKSSAVAKPKRNKYGI